MGVPGHAAADDGAIEHIESGEPGCGAVTLVIMGHGAATSGLERQAGLGAIECLDLTFLVDRHDDGVGGRVHVETDDVLHLLGEGRIVGFLERPDTVRPETMGLPDTLNRAQTDTDRLGHHAAGPVGCGFRRSAAGQRQDFGNRRRWQRRASRLALPAPYRRPARAATNGHLQHGQSLCRKQNYPSPLDMLLRAVAILHNSGQALAVRGVENGADGLCHEGQIA